MEQINKKNEEWLTRKDMFRAKRVKNVKRCFANSLTLNLNKPQTELDEILFPILAKYN